LSAESRAIVLNQYRKEGFVSR